MGACRMGFNLMTKMGRQNFAETVRRKAYCIQWRLTIEDTLGPLVCRALGHRPYNTAMSHEPPEMACHRCHQWLPQSALEGAQARQEGR